MFVVRSVSPAEGASIDGATGVSIVITGHLAVKPGQYYTMVYVWDNGQVFLPGMWGPSNRNSQWDDYRFTQDIQRGGHATAQAFATFCSGHVIEKAVFIASNTDILHQATLNDPGLYLFRRFDFGMAETRIEIPLNYRCR